jgi:hypothetical protein
MEPHGMRFAHCSVCQQTQNVKSTVWTCEVNRKVQVNERAAHQVNATFSRSGQHSLCSYPLINAPSYSCVTCSSLLHTPWLLADLLHSIIVLLLRSVVSISGGREAVRCGAQCCTSHLDQHAEDLWQKSRRATPQYSQDRDLGLKGPW